MKILLLGLLILLFLPVNSLAIKTVISGRFSKGKNQVVSLSYYHTAIDECKKSRSYVDAIADEYGNFILEFDIENPVSANMMIDDDYFFINVIICPGDNVSLEISKSFIGVTGKGEARLAFGIKFMAFQSKLHQSAPSRYGLNPKDYILSRISIMKESLQFFNDNLARDSITDDYKLAFESGMMYNFAVDYCQYSWINPKESQSFYMPDSMAHHLNGIEIDNQQIAGKSGSYSFFLRELPYGLFTNIVNQAHSQKEHDKFLMNQYEIRDSIAQIYFTGENYENALFIILNECISNLNHYQGQSNFETKYKEIKSKLESYRLSFQDKDKYQILEGYLNKHNQESVKILNFSALDKNGNKVMISDFKGKVVYLDFWATSCAPCVAEIPYAKSLQKKLKDEEDFLFVAVSFDRDFKYAKKFIKDKEFDGVHLFDPKGMNSEVARTYNINGIPRYFIIDKEGNLISTDAERPSGHPEDLIIKLLRN